MLAFAGADSGRVGLLVPWRYTRPLTTTCGGSRTRSTCTREAGRPGAGGRAFSQAARHPGVRSPRAFGDWQVHSGRDEEDARACGLPRTRTRAHLWPCVVVHLLPQPATRTAAGALLQPLLPPRAPRLRHERIAGVVWQRVRKLHVIVWGCGGRPAGRARQRSGRNGGRDVDPRGARGCPLLLLPRPLGKLARTLRVQREQAGAGGGRGAAKRRAASQSRRAPTAGFAA